MARLLVLFALLGAAIARPRLARAEEIYSFVDSDGVIHVTNVPDGDKRYRRLRMPTYREPGVHRVTLRGRPPPLLRRTSAWDDHIRAAAARYGVAPSLLKAVMAVESNFNPYAVSDKGATGLMQLMPATARDMYVSDLLDPAQNIEGGARYLRMLIDQFGGDLEKVLAAYNAGPEAVRRAGGAVPNIPETRAYVRKVVELWKAFEAGR